MRWDFFRKKKGEVDWEIAKVIIAAILLIVLALAVAVLFKGKGGDVFSSIKNIMRFGQG
jgi:hypothetical protein